MFTLYRLLPLSVRPTYYYNLRAALFNGVALGIGQLFHTIAAKQLGASSAMLAAIDSMNGLGMIAAFFVGGMVVGRRKIPFVFWPRMTSALAFFMLGYVNVALGFCLLAGSVGMISQAGIPAMASVMRVNFPARIRGMIMGFTRRWFFLTALLASLVASEVIQRWPGTWRGILPIGGFCALVAGFLLQRIRVRGEGEHGPTPEPPPFRPLHPFRVLVRNVRFRHYTTAFFIFGFANIMMRPVLPLVLKQDMGADFRQMQWAWSIIPQIVLILTVSFWGKIIDRSNPITMRSWMNMLWAFMPLLIFSAYFLPPFLPFRAEAIWFAYAGRGLQGLVSGGQGIIWHLGIMYFARRDNVPTYMAAHIGLTGLRAAIAPWVATLLVRLMGDNETARASLFLISSLLMFYSATLLMRLARRMRAESGGRLPSFTEREEAEENGA